MTYSMTPQAVDRRLLVMGAQKNYRGDTCVRVELRTRFPAFFYSWSPCGTRLAMLSISPTISSAPSPPAATLSPWTQIKLQFRFQLQVCSDSQP